jgi:hypothetical protein
MVFLSESGDDCHRTLQGIFQHYCTNGQPLPTLHQCADQLLGKCPAMGTASRAPHGIRDRSLFPESTHFNKFCRQTPGLLDGVFTSADTDVIFAQVKPRGSQRISFPQFLEAMVLISWKKFVSIGNRLIRAQLPLTMR